MNASRTAWVNDRIDQSVREIVADVLNSAPDGHNPDPRRHGALLFARDFSMLHDAVDANEYGGLCDDAPFTHPVQGPLEDEHDVVDWCEEFTDDTNAVQNGVDAIIRHFGGVAGLVAAKAGRRFSVADAATAYARTVPALDIQIG